MRPVSRGVRVLSLSLGLVLAACGGGTSAKNDAGDGSAGADGAAESAGGSDGGAGTGGTAGASAAGQSGHDGGAAGTDGGAAGSDGGAAGSDAGGDVATEAGAGGAGGGVSSDGGDAGALEASADTETEAPPSLGLCGAFAVHAPVVTANIINNGKAPDAAGFLGGTLASGTYFLTSVTHFGATYAGATQEVLVVDATAHTLGDASVVGATTTFVGYATSFPSATVLAGAPSCGGATARSWNYWVVGAGAGSTLSLNAVSSSDVKVFTKQ